MGKIILLILLAIAAICGSCKTSPLLTANANITTKVPYISIGNKYIYYTYLGSPGVVRCDTIEVTAIDGPCIHFCHKKDHYIVDKRRFKYNTVLVKQAPKK